MVQKKVRVGEQNECGQWRQRYAPLFPSSEPLPSLFPLSPLSLRSSSSHKQRVRRARAAQLEAHFGAVGRCSFHFPNGNSYLRYVTPSVRLCRRCHCRRRREEGGPTTPMPLSPSSLPSPPLHSSPSHVCPLTEPAPPLPIPITTGGELARSSARASSFGEANVIGCEG